jgi:hypothetical protein
MPQTRRIATVAPLGQCTEQTADSSHHSFWL